MTIFTEMVIKTIQSIPYGNVMTYGDIAKECGSPRGARQVVRILHTMSEQFDLPWHRVVNSKGRIGFTDKIAYDLQRGMLESEGIAFQLDDSIDLNKYRYKEIYYEDN